MATDISFADLQGARELMRADARRGRHKRRRDLVKPRDRFKRLYTVWLDRYTGDPVGQINPEFSAPVVIPPQYLHVPEDMKWRMETDFVGYARELKQAEREWIASVGFFMQKLFGEKGNLAFSRGEWHSSALALAGPRPERWDLVALAARGDPWCLGFTKKRTPAVVALIGEAEEKPAQRRLALPSEELRLSPALEALLEGRAPAEAAFADEEDDDEAERNYQASLALADGDEDEDSTLSGDDDGDDLPAGAEVHDLDLRGPGDTIGEGDRSGQALDDAEFEALAAEELDGEVELPDFDPARGVRGSHGGHKGAKGNKGQKTQLRRTDGTFARGA